MSSDSTLADPSIVDQHLIEEDSNSGMYQVEKMDYVKRLRLIMQVPLNWTHQTVSLCPEAITR